VGQVTAEDWAGCCNHVVRHNKTTGKMMDWWKMPPTVS
jgi:hypothetical protein